ncbi:alanine/glycine:cation symporter family protein [Haloplasma contractile]|uniref:Sodium-proton-dependent alanine carrier protein n=1 Tax=Haloplasma contractile SSD-17B TaxID=1033810 RepID=U2DYS7_9MOLU|nr:alanine/glycine:cation symporter family protein [Haloplasma contractile]ERJ13397.1 Sodium-proton-dependent alanine carrier protein [Haloplasma contractile SSD-17B]
MFNLIETVNNLVWGAPLVILCLGAGVYFTLRTKFVQLRFLVEMPRLLFGSKETDKGVSSFQAFALAVSGHVGTGNIAGVAMAIFYGGPGSIFWMWAMAILCSASSFVETTLGQIYKKEINGEYRGGPAFYIDKGLGMRWFAILFAVVSVISIGLFLPMVQSANIADAVSTAFRIDRFIVGIIIMVFLGAVIFGGSRRLVHIAEVIVPFMAVSYLIITILVILLNIQELPRVIQLIIDSAFKRDAVFGGIAGSAISLGVKRGIFSNEAGLGSVPNLTASSDVSHPVKQGLVSAFCVYIDTIFICTSTAFMILITGKFNVANPEGGFLYEGLPGVTRYSEYTQESISAVLNNFGPLFVAISLIFFGFTTFMAYYYQAETNLLYLFDRNKKLTFFINVLRVSTLVSVLISTIYTSEFAWKVGDIGVGIIAWLNIIAILLLHKLSLHALKDYEKQKKEGNDPVYKAKYLKNVECWK